MIIMLYEYAASAPPSNFLDTSVAGRATPRQGIYTLIGLDVIVGIVYFLSKR